MKQLCAATFALVVCIACSHPSSASDRHYQMAGEIKSLDAKAHTAEIDAAAIPNYMEAMTMEYPIKSTKEFDQLRVGEHIEATLNVHADDSYDLTNLRSAKPRQ